MSISWINFRELILWPLRYLKNIKNGKVLAPTLLPLAWISFKRGKSTLFSQWALQIALPKAGEQGRVGWSVGHQSWNIEINAWSSLFLNIKTNLILYLYPEKCIKFNQSESRLRNLEIWNFAHHLRLIYRNKRESLI